MSSEDEHRAARFEESFSEGEDSPIEAGRNRLRERISGLENDNQKFAQVADRLNDAAYDREEYFKSEEEDPYDYPEDFDGSFAREKLLHEPEHSYDDEVDEQYSSLDDNSLGNPARSGWRYNLTTRKFGKPGFEDDVQDELEKKTLRKELEQAKHNMYLKDQKLQDAQGKIRALERRVFELEQELKEAKLHIYRASKVPVSKPNRRQDRGNTFDKIEEPVRSDNDQVQDAALRVLEDARDVEHHFRSIANNDNAPLVDPDFSRAVHKRLSRRRPPFLLGGTSSKTENQSVPIPLKDVNAAKIRRLKDQKRLLTEEYRSLLRHGFADEGVGSSRLKELLMLIEQKETKLRKLLGE